MKSFRVMFFTEFKLGLRNMDIIIFGIIFPIVIAAILGLVYDQGNMETMNKTFAAVSTIAIAANGLMGLPLTLSGYRYAKILKQIKVTPVNSILVLLVQFACKLCLSLISLVLIYITMVLLFDFKFLGNPFVFMASYLLVVIAIFGIGMIIASLSPNNNMTGLICSIAYFPMLFLSGATIPLSIFPDFLIKILQAFPLTQGINLLENVSLGIQINNVMFSFVSLLVIGILSFLISIKFFKWE